MSVFEDARKKAAIVDAKKADAIQPESPAEQKAKLDAKVAGIVQTKEAIFKALERGKGNVADLPVSTGVEHRESTVKPGRS